MNKKPVTPKFQSYLIVGSQNQTAIEEVAKRYKVDLNKTSPDITFIKPEKTLRDGRQGSISIDQVREMKREIYQKPVSTRFKIVLIESAEKLTREAQNSLLKVLEEPPPHAIIILDAKNKANLLPTIVSRSTIIRANTQKTLADSSSIFLKHRELKSLLLEVSRVENPTEWLDDQMTLLHNSLVESIKNHQNIDSLNKIQETIEKCKEAKVMIEANVNAKFVLANLVFSLNKTYS